MNHQPDAVPFIPQSDPRFCGAASLEMAYRHLGIARSQELIWPDITEDDRLGRFQLMARDALRQECEVLLAQADDSLTFLERCLEQSVVPILNIRPIFHHHVGHYVIALEINQWDVVVHDPHFGPRRQMSRQRLAELWSPNRYIAGFVVLAVAAANATPATASAKCSKCEADVAMPLGRLLAKDEGDATRRHDDWRRVFCPYCDATLLNNQRTEPT
ncbi:hypothetical protein Pan216_21330 [Planctomycetes bacterium Pan216]|uniref:Peptidase C39 domain-containing protein n=1 Tax=Kolteria novifilia TaxID=2527975 RepID=A0A518B2S2_9BACT|nr:hypothetical protein Pan216_21330 [Planctomycetes bacterium Pan216]